MFTTLELGRISLVCHASPLLSAVARVARSGLGFAGQNRAGLAAAPWVLRRRQLSAVSRPSSQALSAPLTLAFPRPGSCQRHGERAVWPHGPRPAGAGKELPEGHAAVRPSHIVEVGGRDVPMPRWPEGPSLRCCSFSLCLRAHVLPPPSALAVPLTRV